MAATVAILSQVDVLYMALAFLRHFGADMATGSEADLLEDTLVQAIEELTDAPVDPADVALWAERLANAS